MRLQKTMPTYELTRDDFVCASRGSVDVKGKGEMEVWLVLPAREKILERGA